MRPQGISKLAESVPPPPLLREGRATRGQRAAEAIAKTVGSWKFIIFQSCIITVWVILNATHVVRAWDPYPFILMNLVLSLQAAYTAPMILMSQNRQSEKDRKILYGDYVLSGQSNKTMQELLARMEEIETKIERRISTFEYDKTVLAARPTPDLTSTHQLLLTIEAKLNALTSQSR